MNKTTTITAITAITVCMLGLTLIPTVQASIEDFEQALKKLHVKYGIPLTPALTEEQWKEYDKRVEQINKEYDHVYAEIERKVAEIDKEFGVSPVPELTDKQWEQYNAEIEAVFTQYNISKGKPVNDADHKEMFHKLHAIDTKYGLVSPAMTQVNWEEYDKQIAQVYAEYDRIWKEIDAKYTSLEKEFNIQPTPLLTPDQWEQYDKELSALLAKYDVDQTFGAVSSGPDGDVYVETKSETEFMKQYVAIFESFGFVNFDELEETMSAEFWRGLEKLDEKYINHLNVIGDPDYTGDKTESYQILSSEYLPAVQELCGDVQCMPLLTVQQIRELDEQLSDLQERFNNGEL